MTDYENLYAMYLVEARKRLYPSTRDVEHYMRGPDVDAMVGDTPIRMSFDEFLDRTEKIVKDEVIPWIGRAGTVVELGCGYGHNLSILHRPCAPYMVGLEKSYSGVELAKYLFRQSSVVFEVFDMTGSYEMLRKFQAPLVVFTKHAVEQLPTAKPFIDGIMSIRDIVETVINLEPMHGPDIFIEGHKSDPESKRLAKVRREYAKGHNLNTDLLALVKANGSVQHIGPLLLGFSLNSMTSVVRWKP